MLTSFTSLRKVNTDHFGVPMRRRFTAFAALVDAGSRGAMPIDTGQRPGCWGAAVPR